MAARARLRTWAAFVSAMLLAAYAVFSFVVTTAARDAHEHLAVAGAAHHIDASAEGASHDEPAGQCHPGFDCLVTVMLLPDRIEAPVRASRSGRQMPSEGLFPSITLSPQPPPPRVGPVPDQEAMQT